MEVFIVEAIEYRFYEEVVLWCINEDDTELVTLMRYHFN